MKTCIIYSVKNDPRHLRDLQRSLDLVSKNVVSILKNIEFIMFCDPGIESIVKTIFTNSRIPNKLIIKEFITRQPPYNTEIQQRIHNNISYKNMCRFWAGEIFKDKDVLTYDYYMRLDCDSFITEPLVENPFEVMERNNKIYGYITGGKFLDSPEVCANLNNTLKEFEKQNKELILDSVNTLTEGTLYYTNFEICKIKAFTESSYMNLYEFIDQSGGIYIYRWGDHIIRYAGIHMLLGTNLVEEFRNIKYTHQRFINGRIV